MIIQSEREKHFEELKNALTKIQESNYTIITMQANDEIVSKSYEFGSWVKNHTFNIQIDYVVKDGDNFNG